MCRHIYHENELKLKNDAFIDLFNAAYKQLASQGQRVLACATKTMPASNEFNASELTSELTFTGLIGLQDPPKPRVNKAIASCQTAGITVYMVSGDHPLTCESIARQVGLIRGETKLQVATRTNRPIESISEDEYKAVIVHGDDLSQMSNREWHKILAKKEIVFARTSPAQKLEIVARAQAMGHIVAVTGDGVNDAPALKRADLGISMNISGSDVSKEAAKMILMDDDFASIVEGIASGRLVFANLKKAILYTISHISNLN
eukprot:NODE_45_length_32908_cov_0.790271.p18 type:complete len:261 gc:universal NODE_45_length_32908_cov_0.790271:30876-30094(-)